MQNLLSKALFNLFRQNLFLKLVIAQDNARFRIENIHSNFQCLRQMHADGSGKVNCVGRLCYQDLAS